MRYQDEITERRGYDFFVVRVRDNQDGKIKPVCDHKHKSKKSAKRCAKRILKLANKTGIHLYNAQWEIEN